MTGPSATARAFRPRADARYKLIYLARRHPAMAAAEFPVAWRAHSRLASGFVASLGSHFLGVRQCVRDRADPPPAPFTDDYDGSSIMAMRSWADLIAARYHPRALDELAHDEARVFAGPVDDWTMAVEEEVLHERSPGAAVVLSYLAPDPALDSAAFARRSRAGARALACDATQAVRIVWNHVVDPARAYPFAAVTEMWFADRDAMRAAVRTPALATALGQRGVADPARSVHLVATLNLDKNARHGGDGATRWADDR